MIDIAVAWVRRLEEVLGVLSPDIKERGIQRYSICLECEFKKKNKCSKCGCPLSAKVLGNGGCPLNKW